MAFIVFVKKPVVPSIDAKLHWCARHSLLTASEELHFNFGSQQFIMTNIYIHILDLHYLITRKSFYSSNNQLYALYVNCLLGHLIF